MPRASDFLRVAAAEIGYREGYNKIEQYWNNNNKYGAWYGMNGVAWCAQFVSWCANEVGALGTLVPKYASVYAGLTWFRQREQTGYWPPRPGDIFMMREYKPGVWNADADGWATVHTGIVEKYLGDGRVQTIEGNTNTSGSAQGNGVYRLIRQDSPDSPRFIYARPKWDPEPAPAPAPRPTTTAPSRTEPRPALRAPAPYVLPRSQRSVDVSAVRPGKRNEASRRFNALLWETLYRVDRAYCDRNHAAWMKEPSTLYGPQAQKACLHLYTRLYKKAPKTWGKPPAAPAWPGPQLVRYVGGRPV